MIDAHHHLWTYNAEDYPWIPTGSPLQADFGVADLEAAAKRSGVTGSVVVQARQTLAETDWLLRLAEEGDFIRGVVGWVPLADARVGRTLDHLLDRPLLRGVRHVVQDEADGFLDGDAFNRGIEQVTRTGLVYDLLIVERQLPEAIRFVDRHPNQRFVLDHFGKPAIDNTQPDRRSDWFDQIGQLAQRPNIWCKVSGLATEVRGPAGTHGRWTPVLLRPYWDRVLEVFSPSRLLFGSDWPVALFATDYHRWVDTVHGWTDELTVSEQTAIFEDNAIEAYGLGR